MNLPQKIQKSDGAIARSFSQELGLNLDFKTGRTIHWNSLAPYFSLERMLLLLDNSSKLVTYYEKRIRIWDAIQLRLIKELDVETTVSKVAKRNEQSFYAVCNDYIVIIDLQNGLLRENKIAAHNTDKIVYSIKKTLLVHLSSNAIDVYKNDKLIKSYISEDYGSPNYKRFNNISLDKNERFLAILFQQNEQDYMWLINTDNFITIQEHKIDTSFWIVGYDLPNHLYYHHKNNIWKYNLNTKTKEVIQKSLTLIVNEDKFAGNERFIFVEKRSEKKQFIIDAKTQQILKESSDYYKEPLFCDDKIICKREIGDTRNAYFDLFTQDLNQIGTIEILNHPYGLTSYNENQKLFCFYNMLINLNTGKIFSVDSNNTASHKNLNFNNIDNSDFFVVFGKTAISGGDPYDLHFTSVETGKKQVVKSNSVSDRNSLGFPVEFYHYRKLSYVQDFKYWIINFSEGVKIYDALNNQTIMAYHNPDKVRIFKVSKDLKYGLATSGHGTINLVNIDTAYPRAKYELKILPKDKKKISMSEKLSNCFFLDKTSSILLIEINKQSKKPFLEVKETDYLFRTIRSKILSIEISDKYYNSLQNTAINREQTQLVIVFDDNAYLLDIQTFTLETLLFTNIPDEFHKPPIASKDWKYIIFKGQKNDYFLNLRNRALIGEIPSWGYTYYFDINGNTLIQGEKEKTNFFNASTMKKRGVMYIDSKEQFLIKTESDATSPNGWFYTNTPDKVNVLKTKTDGSEPELLPLDDEERLAFIKHHNRKDIVMQKLFEPEKYEEFIKLNANAEDLAKQDMAIELSKVETRRLEP